MNLNAMRSVFFLIFTYALNAKTKIKSITNYAVQLIMRILLQVGHHGIYFCHFVAVCISYTPVFNEVEIVLEIFPIPISMKGSIGLLLQLHYSSGLAVNAF